MPVLAAYPVRVVDRRRWRSLSPQRRFLATQPTPTRCAPRPVRRRRRLHRSITDDLHLRSRTHAPRYTLAAKPRELTPLDPSDGAAVGADPGLQRAEHDRDDPRPGARHADPEGDHLRRRLLHRRHARASRGAARGRLHRPAHPPAAERRQGQGDPHRARGEHGGHRHRAGRRPRVRPAGLARPARSRSSPARRTPASARASSAGRIVCSTTGTPSATRCSRCSATC